MNNKRTSHAFSDDTEITQKLDGMEVEFDEKVTLFPVDLQEIRGVFRQATKRTGVRRGVMH